jgi:pantothenate kinase-related protein Tda10
MGSGNRDRVESRVLQADCRQIQATEDHVTDRTLYTGIRPARSSAPPTQRNRRVEQIAGTHGGGDSRAKIDTVLARLERLAVIIDAHDWRQLREWRLSQMMALEIGGVE